jgi:sulfatase maturation enzyme AslB (radical SAM superfamily)
MRNLYRLARVFAGREKHLFQVNIELASRCNLRCRYCALDPTRKEMLLDPLLFEKLCSNLRTGGYKVNQFVLSHSGEALQHPYFFLFLKTIKDYHAAGGSGTVYLDTNLMLLDKHNADLITKSGAIDVVVCSIDGYDRESFEHLRPPAKFDTVMENLNYLFELENRPDIHINNGNETFILHEYSNEFKYLIARAEKMVCYEFHDWGGQIHPTPLMQRLYGPSFNPPKGLCKFAFRNVVLLSDGTIGKCCRDLNGLTTYGDLKTNSLKEILNSRRRKFDLLKMYLQQRGRVAGCNNCTER